MRDAGQPDRAAGRVRDVLESRGLSPMQFQILNPNNKDVRLYTGPLDRRRTVA